VRPTARLFGVDGTDIDELDPWLLHAGPEKGLAQWRDGYSAKEQAKGWLQSAKPSPSDEWWKGSSARLRAPVLQCELCGCRPGLRRCAGEDDGGDRWLGDSCRVASAMTAHGV
jgi:hypothetical protein